MTTTRTPLRAIGTMGTSDLEDLLDAAQRAGNHELADDIQHELNQRELESALPAYEG